MRNKDVQRFLYNTSDIYSAGQLVHTTGYFLSTRYYNQENGFVIGTFHPDNIDEDIVCKGKVVGYVEGQPYEIEGVVVEDKQYGIQISLKNCKTISPSTKEHLVAFLGSGIIKGCGPATASRIVKHFGEETQDVLENDIKRLSEVRGVSKKTIDRIISELPDKLINQEVIGFFSAHGLSMAVIQHLMMEYGMRAKEVVQENPYVLTRIRGFAFTRADQIAMKLGVAIDDNNRIEAGIVATLRWYCNNHGHTLVPEEMLMDEVYKKLGLDRFLTEEKVSSVKSSLISSGRLIQVGDSLQLPYLYKAEEEIKKSIEQAKMPIRPLVPSDIISKIVSESTGIVSLTDEQSQAVRNAFEKRLSILSGAAGTGKTASQKIITRICDKIGIPYILCSPTGKAAKNLSESCTPKGHKPIPAYTLHRALNIRVSSADDTSLFDDDTLMPSDDETRYDESFGEAIRAFKKAKIVLCDEVSMLDTQMASLLLKKCKNKNLLMIGDPNQLPSIGPGNVLADLFSNDEIPSLKLTKIFRQKNGSPIVDAAHAVLNGENPCTVPGIEFHECLDEKVPDVLEQFVFPLIEREKLGYQDIAFISPMKARTQYSGTNGLNAFLRPILNKDFSDRGEQNWKLQKSDYVTQTKNNYQVSHFNGDQGIISDVDSNGDVTVEFFDDPDSSVIYDAQEVNDNLMLAYAQTIHRFQGSQCDTIVMVLTDPHFIMCTRNLLYTGISRAKKNLILIGNESAYKRAAKNKKETKRYTGLRA